MACPHVGTPMEMALFPMTQEFQDTTIVFSYGWKSPKISWWFPTEGSSCATPMIFLNRTGNRKEGHFLCHRKIPWPVCYVTGFPGEENSCATPITFLSRKGNRKEGHFLCHRKISMTSCCGINIPGEEYSCATPLTFLSRRGNRKEGQFLCHRKFSLDMLGIRWPWWGWQCNFLATFRLRTAPVKMK